MEGESGEMGGRVGGDGRESRGRWAGESGEMGGRVGGDGRESRGRWAGESGDADSGKGIDVDSGGERIC
jgi:hypothetical protein